MIQLLTQYELRGSFAVEVRAPGALLGEIVVLELQNPEFDLIQRSLEFRPEADGGQSNVYDRTIAFDTLYPESSDRDLQK